MKLVLISDTHGDHDNVKVEPCDVLIHSGDFMGGDSFGEFTDFLRWLEKQPAPIKVLVAGNHDKCLEHTPDFCQNLIKEMAPSAIYLQDSGEVINGLKFWGSPVQPRFYNWAFNRDRGSEIKRHWDLIPDDTDVLITHGPPNGILDLSNNWNESTGKKWSDHLGCADLMDVHKRINPKLHVFGHIHGSGGKMMDNGKGTIFANASIMDEAYIPTHVPIVINL